MFLVLAVAPLAAWRHAHGEGPHPAADRAAGLAALSRPVEAPAQGSGAGAQRLVALPGAPYLVFATTWVAAALVPTYATHLMFSWAADLIAIVALLATGRFALALAGMDVGTAFGGIGSSREMMIASLAEPAMLLVVFSVALIAGTTQLSSIAETFIDRIDRPARVARPCAIRLRPAGDRRECPHSDRQPGDPPRTDHGPRGHGAGIFRPAPCHGRSRGGAQACASTARCWLACSCRSASRPPTRASRR